MVAKTETVEEFFARGGQVTRCPVVDNIKPQQVKPITAGPVTIISLGEADLFYGEKSTRKKKEKLPNLSGIDVSHIPEELRKTLGI